MKLFRAHLFWKLLLLALISLLARSFGNADVGVKGISGCNNSTINTED